MKFFVDTADIAEIRDLTAHGLVDGVTTNPSLIAKSGRDFIEVIARDLRAWSRARSAPRSPRLDYEGMMAEGRKLASSRPTSRSRCR